MLKQLHSIHSRFSDKQSRRLPNLPPAGRDWQAMKQGARLPLLKFIEGGRKGPAFSLIELILVMMLIGIVSVIVIPKADNLLTSMRLKAAVSKLKDDLTYIYDYAVTKHDTTWLVVNITENSYGIFSGPSESERELILDPSTNRQRFIDFDEEYTGVQITSVNFSGNVEFFYNWWGTPSSGGQIVLNNSKIINVEPGTGYVYETE